MLGLLLDLLYPFNVEPGFCLYRLQVLRGYETQLGVPFANGDLYVEPFRELVLFCPDASHLLPCVAINHFAPACANSPSSV